MPDEREARMYRAMPIVALVTALAFSAVADENECKRYYWDIELLAPLPGPSENVPYLSLPTDWIHRCEINSANAINTHGDIVATLDPASGPTTLVVNANQTPVLTQGPSIGCGISDDDYLSGATSGEATLWKFQNGAFAPFYLFLPPPSADPSSSILSGSTPYGQIIRQPGNIITHLSGGTYRQGTSWKGLLGNVVSDLSTLSQEFAGDTIVNGVLDLENGTYLTFGAVKLTSHYEPFIVETDGTSSLIRFPLAYESANVGSVHAVNKKGTAVGCAAELQPNEDPTYGAFVSRKLETHIEFQDASADELYAKGSFPAYDTRVSCLHDVNRHDFAVGAVREKTYPIPKEHGFIYSAVTKRTAHSLNSYYLNHPAVARVGDEKADIYAVRGVLDSGVLAANVRIGDERYVARLTPIVQLISLDPFDFEVHQDPNEPPIMRPGDRLEITFNHPVPSTCDFSPPHQAETYYYSSVGYEHAGVKYMSSGLQSPSYRIPIDVSNSFAPSIVTYGVEMAAQRVEARFWFATHNELNCGDGKDNDLDGFIDCEDSDCFGEPCGLGMYSRCGYGECIPPEICTDGIDNNGDGFVDCEDPNCLNRACGPGCTCGSGFQKETNCYDGIDNDGDEAIDCFDPDCEGQACGTIPSGAVCQDQECVETRCYDALSNDYDELTDCDDPDCEGRPCGDATGGAICENGFCVEVICFDGASNDHDDHIDCLDEDCDGRICGNGMGGALCLANDCVEVDCRDSVDNDGDQVADCEDHDCAGKVCYAEGSYCDDEWGTCREWTCNDLIDNDNDGWTDCEDWDCEFQECYLPGSECSGTYCVEWNCFDGISNDYDDLVDCKDPDCDGEDCRLGFCSEGSCQSCRNCPNSACEGRPCAYHAGRIYYCGPDVCEIQETRCGDGIDNDHDDLIDCKDSDCDGRPCGKGKLCRLGECVVP